MKYVRVILLTMIRVFQGYRDPDRFMFYRRKIREAVAARIYVEKLHVHRHTMIFSLDSFSSTITVIWFISRQNFYMKSKIFFFKIKIYWIDYCIVGGIEMMIWNWYCKITIEFYLFKIFASHLKNLKFIYLYL